MKNKLKLSITAIATIMSIGFFAGCASIPPPPPEPLPEPNIKWTVSGEITMELLQHTYPPDVDEIAIVMENRSDMVLEYGEGYFFETYKDGEWIVVDSLNDRAFNDVVYHLYDFDRNILALKFSPTGTLDHGLYRVTGKQGLFIAPANSFFNSEQTFEEYPPWQLEFLISSSAEKAPLEIPGKRAWQWSTPLEVSEAYADIATDDLRFIPGNNGVVAVLYKTPPENDSDFQELYSMEIFQRKFGARQFVFKDEIIEPDTVQTYQDGFVVKNYHLYYISFNEEGVVLRTVIQEHDASA